MEKDYIAQIIEDLRQKLEPAFPISHCDRFAVLPNSKTIRNMRCQKKIPSECFIKEGSRVLMVKEPFLKWFTRRLIQDKAAA